MKGKTVQWFVKSEDVQSVTQSDTNPKRFQITLLHHYWFEADDQEQVMRPILLF